MFADKMRMLTNKSRREMKFRKGLLNEDVWNSVLLKIKDAAERGEYSVTFQIREVRGLEKFKDEVFDELIEEDFIVFEQVDSKVIISWVLQIESDEV